MHLVLLVEHSSARGGLIRGIRVDCLHLGAVFVADRVTNEPPILLELYRGANDGADAWQPRAALGFWRAHEDASALPQVALVFK